MADYKRLTLAQRYLIQSLHHQQYGQEYIAKQVGVSQSTICRELAKYNGQHPHQVYQAQSAQQRASQSLKRTPYKFKGELFDTVLGRIRNRLSPEQVCGELELKTARPNLHHETIYRYIYRHKQYPAAQPIVHEELTQYLRIRHRKEYKDRSKPAKRELIPNRVSIDLRPAIVNTNTEVGHRFGGPMGSRHGHGPLLSLLPVGFAEGYESVAFEGKNKLLALVNQIVHVFY